MSGGETPLGTDKHPQPDAHRLFVPGFTRTFEFDQDQFMGTSNDAYVGVLDISGEQPQHGSSGITHHSSPSS